MRCKLFLLMFLLLSCNIENKESKKSEIKKEGDIIIMGNNKTKEFLDIEKFNKKYSYWDNVEKSGLNVKYINNETSILRKYLKNKEKKLEKINTEIELFSDLNIEDRGVQLLKLLVEIKKDEEKYLLDWTYVNEEVSLILGSQIYDYNEKLPENKIDYNEISEYKAEFFKILEKNFTENEIDIILENLTFDTEYGGYNISGKYGLKKVDKVISELKKEEKISSEEWAIQEGQPYKPFFENEVDTVGRMVCLLDTNKIIIVDQQGNSKKEIKIKDHKKVDIVIYKGILYIYDDDKIYEYSLKNLNDMKIIDVKELEL